MKSLVYGNAIRFWFVAAAVIMICAASKTVHAADARRTIWQSRDQFVAVERQDSATDAPAAANDHPKELTLDRLTALLASLNVRPADNDKPEPLLTSSAVQALAPHLQQGLRQAAPGEDVTFAIIGLHDALYGLAKSPRVTTGRVFYKDGRLNLIVGLAQQEVNDRADRRLSPFTPGSRQKTASGEWTLLPQAGQEAFTLLRKDWVAFGDGWQTPVAPPTAAEKKTAPVQALPAQSIRQHEEARSPVERLTTLKELKDRGLITDEEYRAKRSNILNEL